MKRIFLTALVAVLLCLKTFAQVPYPQLSLTGTPGSGGPFIFLNAGGFAMPTDANYTPAYPNYTCISCTITSTVALTATRNVIMPAGWWIINACNYTQGGQSIQVIGPTGTGATIPNGTCAWVKFDGTNWVLSGGSGGVTSFAAPSGLWPAWLVPTVTNASTTPSLAVAASAIPNSALANDSTTVNGETCTLGSTCTVSESGGVLLNSSTSQTINQSGSSFGVTVNNTASNAVTNTANMSLQTVSTAPGEYVNNGPWATHNGQQDYFYSNSMGIDQLISAAFDPMHTGDAAMIYAYNLFYGGVYFGSDEGNQELNLKGQQVGYFTATLATPTTGGTYEDTGTSSSNVTYINAMSDDNDSPFLPVTGAIESITVNFPHTVVSAYTLDVLLFTPTGTVATPPYISAATMTLATTIPITVAAGTSGQVTYTAGTNFTAVNGTSGQFVGMYWPSGDNGPGQINSTASYCLTGPQTGTAAYPPCAGSPRILVTQAAPTNGSTSLFATGFGCNSHAEGCEGQYQYGWATGGILLDVQNTTPPQLKLASNTTFLNDSMTFNLSSGTVTPSTAYGTISSCTPNTNNSNKQVANSDTCTVVLSTSPASPGDFVAGTDVCLAGVYQEEAAVTAVGTPSSGTQTITINTYNNWFGGTTVMQGGPCGEYMVYNSDLVAGTSYWPMAFMVVGAATSTQISASACVTGSCNNISVSPYPGLMPYGPQHVQSATLTRNTSTGVVSASAVGSINYYPVGSTITVTGCTVDTDLIGSFTVVSNSMDNFNPVLTWDQAGASETDSTCSVNSGTPTVSLFPGAHINGSPTLNTIQLEANQQSAWAAGDAVLEAPVTAYNETDEILLHGQSTPGYNSPAQLVLQDLGPSSVTNNITVTNSYTGGDVLAARGSWDTYFYLNNRPANNGAIIYEAGGEPVSSNPKPYYLFRDGGDSIEVDTVNNVMRFSSPLSLPGAAAGGAGLTFSYGSTYQTALGLTSNTIPNGFTCTGAFEGYYFVSQTNGGGSGVAGPGLTYCNGTSWVPLFTANASTGALTLPTIASINGVAPTGITCASGCTVSGTWPNQSLTASANSAQSLNTGTGGTLTYSSTYDQWTSVQGYGSSSSYPGWIFTNGAGNQAYIANNGQYYGKYFASNPGVVQTSTSGLLTSSAVIAPGILYSAAGTPLPACSSSNNGSRAVVSDATAPLYMTAYTSGGAVTAEVICSYNGTTYAWLTH